MVDDRPRRDASSPGAGRRPDGPRTPGGSHRGERSRPARPGGAGAPKRDSERKPFPKRDGERKPSPKRDGERRPPRDGARRSPSFREDERTPRSREQDELRPVRNRHDDPPIPDEVLPTDLDRGARNELKTLSKENADWVARHLAMAAALIDEDPVLAHQHALSAVRRAGRIAVVRETAAITAYAMGDYALALRELRTYRRISGRDDQIALMVDSERGVGRPDRALEVGRSVDRRALAPGVRVELAIAMSGARLDMGDPDRALLELEIPESDPHRAFSWSPGLFAARAVVLEELGRDDEAARWRAYAEAAEDALASDGDDLIEVDEVDEMDEADEERADAGSASSELQAHRESAE